MSADRVTANLDRVRQTGPGRWLARCPAHEDRCPSLSVRELDDGRTLVHCFAGCAVDSVLRAIGLEMSDLFPPRIGHEPVRARRFGVHPGDALSAVALEAGVVLLAARSMAAGELLVPDDLERLSLAYRRINAAMSVANA